MNLKFVNIVDPCFSKNNLGKSISYHNSFRLKEALKMQQEKLFKVYSRPGLDEAYLFRKLFGFFKYSFECTGVMPSLNLKMPQMRIKKS